MILFRQLSESVRYSSGIQARKKNSGKLSTSHAVDTILLLTDAGSWGCVTLDGKQTSENCRFLHALSCHLERKFVDEIAPMIQILDPSQSSQTQNACNGDGTHLLKGKIYLQRTIVHRCEIIRTGKRKASMSWNETLQSSLENEENGFISHTRRNSNDQRVGKVHALI